MPDVYTKGPIELRLGDYRDVLTGVEPDAVICDPPYGARTHNGNDALPGHRRALCYSHWTEADVRDLCEWAPPGWLVAFSCDALGAVYSQQAACVGRYPFACVPWVAPGSRVRLAGDGPSSWTTWINVSRPRCRPWSSWGTLPGAYVMPSDRGGHIGGKPIELMRALVRDYSRPGDLVCDPCAGGGTTLIAAALEGRRAIGAELDPDTFAKACARIERTALTSPLPGMERPRKAKTADLFGGDS